MVNKLLYLVGGLLCSILLSCKTRMASDTSLSVDTLYLYKASIIDKALLRILLTEKQNFEKKVGQKPNVIKIEFYTATDSLKLKIDSYINLYGNKKERISSGDKFVGGDKLDGTIILIMVNGSVEKLKDYISFSSVKENVLLLNGGDMTWCMSQYTQIQNEFRETYNMCPYIIR